jgi:hypothetical protein
MESSFDWSGVVNTAIWLLAACAIWYFRNALLSQRKIMLAFAAMLPWLMAGWFLLAIGGCLSAVSRIGAGSTEIPAFLLVGGFGFPVFLPLSLYIRKLIRKRFSPVSATPA